MNNDASDNTIFSAPGTADNFVPALAPGVAFDDYKLIQCLGKGGMGEVWRAADIPGKREVAIKFVPQDIQNAESEMRRVEEMFAQVHSLQHEHICPMYVMKQTPGFGTYLVMRFIDGVPLSKAAREIRRKSGRFPLDELLKILKPIASALDYAHRKKVLHRDVKPSNIMVMRDHATGEVVDVQLIDFGLAATFRASLSRVSQQQMNNSGTRPYMAPEQWRGKKQCPATDQYSLAVTAYEMLNDGEFPFEADDPETIRLAVLNESPDSIPGQPDAVNRALMRALAKAPKERFGSCEEFIRQMEGVESAKTEKRGKKPQQETPQPAPAVDIPDEVAQRLGLSRGRIKAIAPEYDPASEMKGNEEDYELNTITDSDLVYLQKMTQLREIDFSYADCSDITDVGLGYLCNLPKLQSLKIRGATHITDKGLEHLKTMMQLQTLTLDYCNQLTITALCRVKDALPGCYISRDGGIVRTTKDEAKAMAENEASNKGAINGLVIGAIGGSILTGWLGWSILSIIILGAIGGGIVGAFVGALIFGSMVE